eukprot:CAMPEP_0185588194 /NCGR_PEP_ID=MMETSP0434-20130131/52138_1 /TAXON_ID=626734 ORGANISM="Favella taraikaensis, Strain Fe Narragansett Bay" /NCGR_SAMPLE_ID=MMETSP0434 /ASSEMBLY_ACC=CAM_ASM_000379 /LENGTH=45 /DNA_ID= /DNA_START= /DNA_END= /DNA_ORIENTATION=
MINLDKFTSFKNNSVFELEELSSRSWEFDDTTLMNVSFEMNLDKK